MNAERSTEQRLIITLVAAALGLVGSCEDNGDDGGQAAAAKSKLEKCGLISDGELNLEDLTGGSEEDACFVDCFLNASCADAKVTFCNDEVSEGDLSDAYLACGRACLETVECELAVVEGLEIDAAYKCNGFEECADGADEETCTFFACADGTEEVLLDYKCDGVLDCADESDEAGCPEGPTFTCEDGQKVPADFECDLEPDCEDGSDEHDGCAQLLCE